MRRPSARPRSRPLHPRPPPLRLGPDAHRRRRRSCAESARGGGGAEASEAAAALADAATGDTRRSGGGRARARGGGGGRIAAALLASAALQPPTAGTPPTGPTPTTALPPAYASDHPAALAEAAPPDPAALAITLAEILAEVVIDRAASANPIASVTSVLEYASEWGAWWGR